MAKNDIYQKQVFVGNKEQNGAEIMQTAYDGTKDLFGETLNLTKELCGKIETANDKVMSEREKVIAEKEEGSKARIDTYSNEKGKEANEQYRVYLEGSIAENFSTKTSLVEEKLALMKQISILKMQLNEEKAQTELELMKKKNETKIECDKMLAEAEWQLEKTKKEISALKKPTIIQKIWNIACPFLGIGLGALTYFLMWVIL